MWTSGEVTIGRLRVQRGGGTDADPGRPAERAIGMLDLRPSGLPRGAILCVRRLRDPAPGTLRLDGRDNATAAAWGASVEAALAGLASRAARPADGPVPAGAEAVLFRDEVELMACLAADWSQPGGRANWWWLRVGRPSLDGSVARAWLSAVPALPAVVDRLARRGELRRALGALDEADVLDLVRALAITYGVSLPASWRLVSTPGPGKHPASAERRPAAPGVVALARTRGSRGTLAPVAGPWAGIEGDLVGLDRARQLLAGIALALHRREAIVRGPAFTAALEEWVVPARARLPRHVDPPVSGTGSAGPGAPRLVRGAGSVTQASPSPRRARTDGPVAPPARRRDSASRDAGWTADGPRPKASAMAPVPSRQAALERQPDEAPATHVGREIETRLGGVFFLLDLALYLDLYGDFSRPRQPGIGLDPWDFLVLLGGELGVREELATDALGDLLRELSGRADGSRPGDGWDPGADWRMPPEWLTPFEVGTEPWRWSAAHQRLRVDHPAGFRVVDIALDGHPTAARARRALRRLPSRPQIRRGSLPLVPTAGRRGVDRWIALLGLYARSRLRLALGAAAAAELAPTLLRLPARVTTTALEVDVEFDLASLPISVRIAGLDRDPGWIPAARRTVTYHFR